MNKLKDNLLIKNIIILLVSGALTKILGMVGKIIYTRIAGINVVSLYTMITPTFMLLISICQFSFPISISKLSAEEKYKDNDLLKNAYLIGIIINIILIIFIILFSDFISNMLHNKSLAPIIRTITFILPFVTISSIQRGFLHGKENMLPASITNITEEMIKIALIIGILPFSIVKSNITAVISIILFNIITEVVSITIMQKTINKKYLKTKDSNINKKIIKEIIDISIPTTLVRLISSLGFFLEPIILTNILLKTGFSSNYITLEYGIINSYVIPLLSIPTFFSLSIASALLPNLTKEYTIKRYKQFNRKLLKLMLLSMCVGSICLIFILLFPKFILNTIYNINLGINYIYLVGPFFLILYMQPTLTAAIQSMNKTNKLFKVSITSMLCKYISLTIFGLLNKGMKSLIYAIIIGIITTTLQLIIIVLKELSNKNTDYI